MLRKGTVFPSIVDDFFGKDFLTGFFDDRTGISMPSVNIIEDKDDFRIELAAPSLDKEDFKLDLHNNVLTISSEKEQKNKEEDGRYMRREFCYHSFRRSFALPNTVQTNKITASYKDGVLNIVIPKRDEDKEKPAREIKIS
ncbi:MAG: Hsp20/alpha crystallin family protein [Bacteroidales bacterium]|nr:Hsp20/alpha crystallin family protein [Bacteroidales bacterium]MDZ4205481.1 Hsp20/alpha crystallin family protein [Bacteroidales bacterium]